jgi:hypothetical protein
VFAVVVWLAASAGFAFYASGFASYNKTWGSLSAVIIILTWLWLSASALLIGGEINAEAERSRELRQGQPLPPRSKPRRRIDPAIPLSRFACLGVFNTPAPRERALGQLYRLLLWRLAHAVPERRSSTCGTMGVAAIPTTHEARRRAAGSGPSAARRKACDPGETTAGGLEGMAGRVCRTCWQSASDTSVWNRRMVESNGHGDL